MQNNEAEKALLARVAWLYYIDGLTQGDIGDLLNISRIKVSRMLDEGRESGLIDIRVNTFHHGCHTLEAELNARFGLKDCRVIPAVGAEKLNMRLGDAAAQYLMQKMQANNLLAVGWGETVSNAIRKLGHVARERDLSIVTLTGGVQTYVDGMRATSWDNSMYVVPAPLLVSNAALCSALAQEKSVATLLNMAVGADYKLIGIGGITDGATVVKQGVILPNEVEPLRRMGAVGDILCRFYDRDGRQLDIPLHERVVGVDLEQLRQSERVIAVAGGATKVEPILAAMRGHLFDILITDEETAGLLLA